MLACSAVAGALTVALPAAPAGAAMSDVCVARTAAKVGNVSWVLRQASGLTTVPSSPGVLFTHNDRGIRDSPAPGEDTTFATVWAVRPDGKALARFRLVDGVGAPIPYFDTEAISTDPSGRIVLADTGTNVDNRVTVALYRFTPDVVTLSQPFTTKDLEAEVIPIRYFDRPSSTSPVRLNVEAFTIDQTGGAWFIPRKATLPYSYLVPAGALDAAAGTSSPARAVRSTRLKVNGPMTDASIARVSATLTMLLVKTPTLIYAYGLAGATPDVATRLGTTPCLVATAADKHAAGYGEAIVARSDGGFYTLAEGSKTVHTGTASAIWSFSV
jgi:hypothetical protein